MNASAIDPASDVDLMVYADWLYDQGLEEVSALVRGLPEELKRLNAFQRKLEKEGHVFVNKATLMLRHEHADKLILSEFTPAPGHSGRQIGVHPRRDDFFSGNIEPGATGTSGVLPAPSLAGVCRHSSLLAECVLQARLFSGRDCKTHSNLNALIVFVSGKTS